METCSVARCLSALILVVTVSVIGMPLPARAAGEDRVTATRHRGLTFNGRPLSEFAALPAPLQTAPDNRRRVSADEFLDRAPVTDSLVNWRSFSNPAMRWLCGTKQVARHEAGCYRSPARRLW